MDFSIASVVSSFLATPLDLSFSSPFLGGADINTTYASCSSTDSRSGLAFVFTVFDLPSCSFSDSGDANRDLLRKVRLSRWGSTDADMSTREASL